MGAEITWYVKVKVPVDEVLTVDAVTSTEAAQEVRRQHPDKEIISVDHVYDQDDLCSNCGCFMPEGCGGLFEGEKRFSLFNTYKWSDAAGVRPACCSVVPVLFNGLFTTDDANEVMAILGREGSAAAPGFMQPEGIIIYHHAANLYFKKTLSKDEEWKGKQAA